MRLGDFPAVGFAELRKRAARLPWERCLAPGQPVTLRVTCHKSRLYHSDAVAERVAGAVADRLGRPSSVCKFDEEEAGIPPQLTVVRLVHDHCTISVDSSGELLHRRGYRDDYVPGHVQEFCRDSFAFACGKAGLRLDVWETYAVNPIKYALYRVLPVGNKARVLVRRA